MKKMVFRDESSETIHSFTWENDKELYHIGEPYTYEIPKLYTNFLEATDDSIDFYKPINDGEDFEIKYCQNPLIDFLGIYNPNELLNQVLGEVFPFFNDMGFIDLARKVYLTGETVNYTLYFFEDDYLQKTFFGKLVNSDNYIFNMIRKDDNFDLTYTGEYDMFYLSETPMVVIQDGIFVRCNQAYADLSGYSVQQILGREFIFNGTYSENTPDFFVPYQKTINNELPAFSEIVRITHRLGGYKWFKLLAIRVSYRDRPAVQCICSDITDLKIKVDEAKKLQENIEKIQNISKVVFASFERGKGFSWTSEVNEIFEYHNLDTNTSNELPLLRLVDSEQKDKLFDSIKKAIIDRCPEIDATIKVNSNLGNEKYISTYTKFYYDDEGLHHAYGFMQDVTEAKLYDIKLKDTLNQLEVAVKDKEILVKEVHHRVKNNLQIILSLMNIDARFNKDHPERTISATINRINSMALIHDQIYTSNDLKSVDMKNYIQDEIISLFNLYNVENIKFNGDLDSVILDIDKSIPIGLIINEIVHNIIKYAFPNGEYGNLFVSLKEGQDGDCVLKLFDDGVGMPDDVDVYNSSSLGMIVINNLVRQIEGQLIKLDDISGTGFEIRFKI